MAKGDRLPAEWRCFRDPGTGVEGRQLTNYRGNSYHLYFTHPGWYRGGGSLLFGSDRCGDTNLFGIDLASGEITQLTDYRTPPLPGGRSFHMASVNPEREEVYFWHERALIALDLVTLQERTLTEVPDGFRPGNTNVTADGRQVCSVLVEDFASRINLDLGHGYVGFRELWEAHPLCRVIAVDVETGAERCVFEEREWIGHVNTSPRRANLLTFCHEGPWNLVAQRMWALDLDSGRSWPLRSQAAGERVGHEYWLQDGERIGYQGWDTGGRHFYGAIRWDDSDRVEAPFPHGSNHFHSNDLDLIVGDGSREAPQLLLWRYRDGQFEGPRIALSHRCSFRSQDVHVHPRFSLDGRHIVYVSDAGGYGNVYMIERPDFDRLPPMEAGAI